MLDVIAVVISDTKLSTFKVRVDMSGSFDGIDVVAVWLGRIRFGGESGVAPAS